MFSVIPKIFKTFPLVFYYNNFFKTFKNVINYQSINSNKILLGIKAIRIAANNFWPTYLREIHRNFLSTLFNGDGTISASITVQDGPY